jgi:hypothetical protein
VKEFYLSILLDRSSGRNVIMYSTEGGMNIEDVAHDTPEKIFREWVHPGGALQAFQARKIAFNLGLSGEALTERGHTWVVRAAPLRDLQLAFVYVWARPALLGATALAFLVNLLAYPFFLGLLPYMARDVYGVGQGGLGYLAAAFAAGGLIGSLVISAKRPPPRAGRTMLLATFAWFGVVLALANVTSFAIGLCLMVAAGVAHNFCLMPLAAVMLNGSEAHMRGRVMGMRMLAVLGLPIGLLITGPLISGIGFAATTALYAILGLALTLAIAVAWRAALWQPAAHANARA